MKNDTEKGGEMMAAINKPQESMIIARGMTKAFVELLASEKRPKTYWDDCSSTKKTVSSSTMNKLKEMCNGDK